MSHDPEDCQRAQEVVILADDGKRREGDIAPRVISASQPDDFRDSATMLVGLHQWPIFDRNRIALNIVDGEERGPLTRLHVARLIKTLIEYRLGGLVIEDQRAFGIHDADGHRQTAGELSGQNDFNELLG